MTLSPTSRSPARVDDIPLAPQTPGAVPGLAEADGRRIAEALHTPAAPTPGQPTPPPGGGSPPGPRLAGVVPDGGAGAGGGLSDRAGGRTPAQRRHPPAAPFLGGGSTPERRVRRPHSPRWRQPGPGGTGPGQRHPQRQARPLTAEALAAIRATARLPRRSQGRAGRMETAGVAGRLGLVDIALASTLRDGLLRRSEAAALRRGDVELLADGSGRLHVRQSKGDQEGSGAVLYLGPDAVRDLLAIRPPWGGDRCPGSGLRPVGQPDRAASGAGGAVARSSGGPSQ